MTTFSSFLAHLPETPIQSLPVPSFQWVEGILGHPKGAVGTPTVPLCHSPGMEVARG